MESIESLLSPSTSSQFFNVKYLVIIHLDIKMSNQTTIVPQLHVGTPPIKSINANKWEVIEVHCNGFEDLPSERGVLILSPAFTSFGHKWRLRIYPGGDTIASDEGMWQSPLKIYPIKALQLTLDSSSKINMVERKKVLCQSKYGQRAMEQNLLLME